jgi:hypothetical protein
VGQYEVMQSPPDIESAGNSGYDPTKAGGGVPPDATASKRMDYLRAEAACLDARGYSVK